MNAPNRQSGQTLFNPPLRIFASITSDDALRASMIQGPFSRPKLQSQITHDRVSRHFHQRRFFPRSRLD